MGRHGTPPRTSVDQQRSRSMHGSVTPRCCCKQTNSHLSIESETSMKAHFFTRREMLQRTGMGMGAVALTSLLGETGQLKAGTGAEMINPLAPRKPQFPGKAKRVIHLFMNGGPSHVDTFDPKPALQKYANKPIPITLKTERRTGAAFPSPFEFKPHGRSGIEVSEIFSKVGECVDDLCIVRSMCSDIPNHE